MFIVIIDFPPIQPGKDAAFREWFVQTNEEFGKHEGFISRRLLNPLKGGNYAAIVEHESHASFMQMHDTVAHAEASARVAPLLDGSRSPQFYDVVTG